MMRGTATTSDSGRTASESVTMRRPVLIGAGYRVFNCTNAPVSSLMAFGAYPRRRPHHEPGRRRGRLDRGTVDESDQRLRTPPA